ncbi:MAG TPA: hypothetical protein VHF69_04565 [Candidatus Synoicihabitans sp.]|nr:hypothetical protein [Candidatus Synoicihabitans sp.]
MTILEECALMLRGIAQYTRSQRTWQAFLDDEGRAESDPRWLRAKRWFGVISRHTSPQLVREGAELRVPLVDLSDGEPYLQSRRSGPIILRLGTWALNTSSSVGSEISRSADSAIVAGQMTS